MVFNFLQPIEREEKPFKPLVIPKKLQEALPYRDKPKNGVKFDELKKSLERVAVIREPHEEKVIKFAGFILFLIFFCF